MGGDGSRSGRMAGPSKETGHEIRKLMCNVYITLKHMAGEEWYTDVGFWKYNKV